MSQTKEIKINEKNSKLFAQMSTFNKRWDIQNNTEDRQGFKIRCLNVINEELSKNSFGNPAISKQINLVSNYCMEIASCLGISTKSYLYSSFTNSDLYRHINSLYMPNDSNFKEFLFYLQLTLNFVYDGIILNDTLAQKIAEAMKLSNIPAKILFVNGMYEIYPSKTEFIDEPLVIDVLKWLDNYPEVKKYYSEAINTERNDKNNRHIVDDLRMSLEKFLQLFFNNKKTIEKQISNVGNFLKENNISVQISNTYEKLIDYYMKYNDDNAKHGDNINSIEIDFLIYLTGSFIRFFVLILEESKKI